MAVMRSPDVSIQPAALLYPRHLSICGLRTASSQSHTGLCNSKYKIFSVPPLLKRLAVPFHVFICIVRANNALRAQFFRIQRARARMLRDLFVHQGLSDRGRILFIMAEPAETDDIHHHILVESGAK